jgi:phage shock protein PspC (stress-responsive transcriptional regulator)
MNKILNINLGGYALTIDDDAYEYLGSYINNIKGRFSESDGRDEIMRDVESRLGELLTMGLGTRQIVMLPDVKAAVEVMGRPEDFGGEPSADTKVPPTSGTRTKSVFEQTVTPGKRLFRDEQDAVLAGVCSGLSAYFGIKDPVWMRFIFILLTVTTGFGVLLYPLLWAIVPPARTTAERLEMRGEAVNVDTIARELEQSNERVQRQATPVAAGCAKILGIIALVFLVIIAISVIMGLGGAWLGGTVALFAVTPYLAYFSPFGSFWTFVAFLMASLVLLLPVAAILMWLSSLIFRTKNPGWLKTGMSVAWVVSVVGLLVMSLFGAQAYRYSNSISTPINTDWTGDTLHIEVPPNMLNETYGSEIDDVEIRNGGLNLPAWLDIHVTKSNTSNIAAQLIMTARGYNESDAQQNAEVINFNVTNDGRTLYVPHRMFIPDGQKYRFQNADLRVQIPIGKYVVFGPRTNHYVEYRGGDYDRNWYHRGIKSNQVYKMTDSGLVCASCPGFGEPGYDEGEHFEDFVLEGDFDTEIRRGDDFKIEITGSTADKSILSNIQSGHQLTLTTNGRPISGSLKVVIYTRTFTELVANNTGTVNIRGFDEGHSSIIIKGRSKVKGDFRSNDLDVTMTGPCSLELNGASNDLDVTLDEGANLDASAWTTNDAKIQAKSSAKARINAKDQARINSDSSSDVTVSGSASVTRE